LENITPTENSNAETTLESSSPPGVGLAPATWAIAGAVGKWVGEKVAGGIVGAAAGKLFSEVMDAIGMGGPDLVVKLDQISGHDFRAGYEAGLNRPTQTPTLTGRVRASHDLVPAEQQAPSPQSPVRT